MRTIAEKDQHKMAEVKKENRRIAREAKKHMFEMNGLPEVADEHH